MMWQLSEAWHEALWLVFVWLSAVHVLYYTSAWCRQRRQLRISETAAEYAELMRRMSVPTRGPAIGHVCDGPACAAIGCTAPCAAQWRATRSFCETYADPGLLDTNP